jgi:hypothetical protein
LKVAAVLSNAPTHGILPNAAKITFSIILPFFINPPHCLIKNLTEKRPYLKIKILLKYAYPLEGLEGGSDFFNYGIGWEVFFTLDHGEKGVTYGFVLRKEAFFAVF